MHQLSSDLAADPRVPSEGSDVDMGVHALDDTGGRRIALPWLPPGTVLHLRTRNSRYQLVVVDGPEGRVLITGGRHFPDQMPVQVVGATPGDGRVKPDWIVEGLRLQLLTAQGCVITSPVNSFLFGGEANRGDSDRER